MINIYYFNINAIISSKDFIKKYIDLVSVDRKSKIIYYKKDSDILLSLISEIIVRQQCIKYLNCNNKDIYFRKNKYGKPYLDNNHLFFNISHSNETLVVAFSDKEIGVDIEKIGFCNFNIANRCFCENEYNYIVSKFKDKDVRFFDIWTKKEAYIKYLGIGLLKPLNSFNVLSDDFDMHSYGFRINSYIISLYSEYELIDASKINVTLLNGNDIYSLAKQLLK